MTSLAQEVERLDWYHVLELPGGVVTPGHFDCRAVRDTVPLPDRLDGRRCLDVGTWDGFWAFEMERRGAAEVVAVDLQDATQWDWPAGGADHDRIYLDAVKGGNRAFEVAREALGSKVDKRELSVYDLSPETVGTFDFAYLGTLLMHLRDPVEALTALRSVVTGEAVIADGVEAISSWLRPRTPVARLEGQTRPWWWQPNRAALRRMVEAAGFEVIEATPVYFLPTGPAHPRPKLTLSSLRSLSTPAGREAFLVRFKGVPHAALRVR